MLYGRWTAMLAVAGLGLGCSTQYRNTAFQSYAVELYGPVKPTPERDPFQLTTQFTVTVSYFEDAAGQVPYGSSLKTMPKGYEKFSPTVVSTFQGSPAAGTLTSDGQDVKLPRLGSDQTSFFVTTQVDGFNAQHQPVARARCPLQEVKADATGQLGPVTCHALYNTLGQWTPTRAMNTPRVDFAAVALPDGRVVVAGGRPPTSDSSAHPLDSIEIYDPAARDGTAPLEAPGLWRTQTEVTLREARSGLTATLLPDGRVLFAGGFNASQQPSSAVEIYDPNHAPGATPLAARPGTLPDNETRAEHAAALLGSSVVLLAGGVSGPSLAPATSLDELVFESPSADQSLPQPNEVERHFPCMAPLDASRVLLCSGTWDAEGKPSGSSCEVLDGSEVRASGMSATPRLQTRCGVVNGQAFVVGGELAGTQPSIERWKGDQLAAWAPSPYPMVDHAVAVGNGKVVVAGGRAPSMDAMNANPPLASAFVIDPAASAPTMLPAMLLPRAGHSLVSMPDGSVMAVGGSTDGRAEILTVP